MGRKRSKTRKGSRSPAYTLCQHVWDHVQEATRHSWERLNATMAGALGLAIGGGLRFEVADFVDIFDDFRGDYWGAYGTGGWEGYYRKAIQCGNMSAVKSFESWKGRPPFIVDDREEWGFSGPKKRLYAGAEFRWKGEHATVTSFSQDGPAVIACSYKDRQNPDAYERAKIARRYTISVADIHADRKDRVERKALHDALVAWQSDNKKRTAAVTAELKRNKVKNHGDFFTIPIERFRKMVADVGATVASVTKGQSE